MSEKSNKSVRDIKLSDLPTSLTDGVNIACRIDGGVLLQFISDTPGLLIENFRTVMVKTEAIEFLENLALALDHYPVKKPTKTPAAKARKPASVSK